MKNELCVSLLQMNVTDHLKENLDQAASYVQKAKDMGADLAVLPEMFCCPYENAAFVKYSQKKGEEIWQRLSEIAAENSLYLVGGSFPEKDEEGRIYNSSFIFAPDGTEIGNHRKVHLFDINVPGGQQFMESKTFTAGSKITVVDTEFGKLGIAICFDIRFPELSRAMALEGARAIIVPAAFNDTTGPAHWEIHFRSRAVDNQIFVLGCAPARNPEGPYFSYGNSIIVDPWGNIMGRLDKQPGMLTRRINLCEIETIRERLPLLSSLRKDLYVVGKRTRAEDAV